MIPHVYTAQGELTAPVFACNFAQGCGGQVVYDYTPGAWAGFGSPQTWRWMERAKAEGFDWFYGDHAYFGRRHLFRITKNAFQHDGYGKPDYERYGRFVLPIRSWRKTGRNIVICAQTQSHYDRHGVSDWVKDTINELVKSTDRDIVVREKRGNAHLSHDLANAWAVVTHTSNAAVDAAIAGIPVFTTHPCAASRVAKSSLAEIERPLYADDRRDWAGALAANQWTMDEIRSGKAWRHLQGMI
jgi:hypothetical protein